MVVRPRAPGSPPPRFTGGFVASAPCWLSVIAVRPFCAASRTCHLTGHGRASPCAPRTTPAVRCDAHAGRDDHQEICTFRTVRSLPTVEADDRVRSGDAAAECHALPGRTGCGTLGK
ncbi:hypothetical protein GCM10010341_25400 [Streptomyces noursei]|nr:hypothetical protein GCM10010341_25400 [Streptomyces noursei]